GKTATKLTLGDETIGWKAVNYGQSLQLTDNFGNVTESYQTGTWPNQRTSIKYKNMVYSVNGSLQGNWNYTTQTTDPPNFTLQPVAGIVPTSSHVTGNVMDIDGD